MQGVTMETSCGTCEFSRKNAGRMVFCMLFGIFIHANHTGCKYQKPGRDANAEIDKGRSGADVWGES